MPVREACGGNPAEGVKFHVRNGLRLGNQVASSLALAATLGFALSTLVLAQNTEQSSAEKESKPAPAHDISGTWALRAPRGTGFGWYNYALMADEPPMTPWAEEKFKANRPSFGPHPQEDSNDPAYSCLPNSVPRVYAAVQASMQIIQIQGRTVMFFGRGMRQIYADGRAHPKDAHELWMGHSIGRWEGETFIVDTVGITDRDWLDRMGHPHSNQLHLVERLRRVDYDTLLLDMTIDDPIAYTRSWNATQRTFRLRRPPNDRAAEGICEDAFLNEAYGLKPKLPSRK
jgi:hypothetical protein